MEEITRQLETAAEIYDGIVFNTDATFNKPAPEPVVAFAIGGVSLQFEDYKCCHVTIRSSLSTTCISLYFFPPYNFIPFHSQVLLVCAIFMWCHRIGKLKKKLAALNPPIILTGNALARAWISCAIDSDSPFYVIVSFGAVSFLFLGGVQLDYKWTLLAMIILYTVSSLGETVRILLALSSSASLADVVMTSDILASQLRGVSTELKPSNVYEDMGRGKTIVVMVFITQVILISFVVSYKL